MSFKVNLEVGGRTYEVLNSFFELNQETDASGRPSAVVRGGKLTVSLESTSNTFFIENMIDNFTRLDGKLIYLKRDTNAKMKEVKFEEAYVVGYSETFSGGGVTGSNKFDNVSDQNPTIETITFSARVLSVENAVLTKQWAEPM
ncbi:type VI secretion system tube protein TssD [Bernardetia sp. MNP-M8]|uniref:type VI secretion system tube protein TssD n=1 Tax=Bernardetia sp. MNP-M8 TaxID=3127470 RepID=UPI0030D5E68A